MDLDAGLMGAMATLVGASVFSIGFLTTRVHDALNRATDRAARIDDRLLDAAAGSANFDPKWLEQEQAPLLEAFNTQYPKLIEGAAWVFTALVVVLAVIAGFDAGVDSWPNAATLAAFVIAALVIVSVGTLDRLRVAALLKRRIESTLLRRREGAVAQVNTALSLAMHHGPHKEHADEAERLADELVEITGSAWPDAIALAILADVARHYDGRDAGRWQGSEEALESLVKQFGELVQRSPQRRSWWRTLSRLAELRADWERAATAWLGSDPAWVPFDGSSQPFYLNPEKPETFERALALLEAQGALHTDTAEATFRELARVLAPAASSEPELPASLRSWMERITRAKLVESEVLGFSHAEVWLANVQPPLIDWPALQDEADRLLQALVLPARDRFYSRFEVD